MLCPSPSEPVSVVASRMDEVGFRGLRAPCLNRCRTSVLDAEPEHIQECSIALVHCPEGHVMKAKVVREVFNMVIGWHYQTLCNCCSQAISTKDACYYCACCRFSLCVSCSCTRHEDILLSQPRTGPRLFSSAMISSCDVSPKSSVRSGYISAGDILFCGPDGWGIHHVILCRSITRPATLDMVKFLERGSDAEVYECLTIESSRPLRGQNFAWYPSSSFFEVDKRTGKAMLIADVAEGSRRVNVVEEPIPVKLLMHPLRPCYGGPTLDVEIFHDAVGRAEKTSRKWGHRTAIKSVAASFLRTRLNAGSFLDSTARAALMKDMRRRWEKKPICASVAIQVWQLYFTLVSPSSPEGEDVAAENILQWMPVHSDKTAPSTLLQVLSTSGWTLRDNIEF